MIKFKDNKYDGSIKGQFKTFKIPLKAVASDYFISKIHEIVPILNNLVIHSYQFIKLYCLYCFHNNYPVEINPELIRISISILREVKKTSDFKNQALLNSLQWFYETEYKSTVNHVKPNIKYLGHFIANIAVQIETMISNNIQERFITHLLRFINETTKGYPKEKVFEFKRNLLNCENIDPMFYPWMQSYYSQIFPFKIDKSVHYHIKANPLLYLRSMLYMSFILENAGLKTFHVLPLRSNIVPCNVMIDTSTLADYFMFYEDKTKTKIKPQYVKEQDFIWKCFLKTETHKIFKSKDYRFYYQIQTDGISCSLLFLRKDVTHIKQEKEEEFIFPKLEELPLGNYNVVGCDPGKANLLYLHDSHGKSLSYSAVQRRHEAKHKQNSWKTQKLKDKFNIHEMESLVSECDSKTVNYLKFKEYLQKKIIVNYQTQNFYNHPTFRKMKLRSFIEGKRSEDKFVASIEKTFGENCILAYGNWSRNDQMKHFIPTKGVGLRKVIHRKYLTVTVNEAYTTKRCCECFKDLRNYVADDTNKKVRGLLVCENCIKSTNQNSRNVSPEDKRIVFRNRDKNAAINIMNVARYYFMSGQRHPCFTNLSSSSFIGVS